MKYITDFEYQKALSVFTELLNAEVADKCIHGVKT